MDKYIAHDEDNGESQIFETFEAAEKWLITDNDFSDGIPEEFEDGNCFIAKITHRTTMIITDEKKNYHEHTDSCPENCNEEEWPYQDDFDEVGKVVLECIEDEK